MADGLSAPGVCGVCGEGVGPRDAGTTCLSVRERAVLHPTGREGGGGIGRGAYRRDTEKERRREGRGARQKRRETERDTTGGRGVTLQIAACPPQPRNGAIFPLSLLACPHTPPPPTSSLRGSPGTVSDVCSQVLCCVTPGFER